MPGAFFIGRAGGFMFFVGAGFADILADIFILKPYDQNDDEDNDE